MVVVEDKNGNPYLVNQENIRFAHVVEYKSFKGDGYNSTLCVEIKFIGQDEKEQGLLIGVKDIEDAKYLIEELSLI